MDAAAAANEALAEECLRASAFVYAESRKRLREQQALEGEPLREVKRAAMSMNRAVAEYIKRARAREDRLLVELHLLRQAAERDATDRDANRARIYEVLRRNFESGHADDGPLERAMGTVARLEASIAALSPTGTIHTHGAGMLAAAARAQAARAGEDAGAAPLAAAS